MILELSQLLTDEFRGHIKYLNRLVLPAASGMSLSCWVYARRGIVRTQRWADR